jgi:2-polyprenyl-3-methyl-5-hydroxy-6-metoxy-1,4-benzoquinol methylase
MNYDQYTHNSKNPIVRYAHRSRLSNALSLFKNSTSLDILDFGCGDGNFLNSLSIGNRSLGSRSIGFEPYMPIKKDFKNLHIYSDWTQVISNTKEHALFDVVTCFEVMEHFSEELQINNLNKIKEVMKDSGKLIISVPIEKGLMSIIKNVRRISISYSGNKHIYTLKNIICSAFGIKTQDLKKLREGSDYLSHMGFYFDDFEKILEQNFIIKEKRLSPFNRLSFQFNSQVFYTLNKKP